eukprot:357298-Chlamydomonas_euryale.AAC.6
MSTVRADPISAEQAASSAWADLCVAEVLLPDPLWLTAGPAWGLDRACLGPELASRCATPMPAWPA